MTREPTIYFCRYCEELDKTNTKHHLWKGYISEFEMHENGINFHFLGMLLLRALIDALIGHLFGYLKSEKLCQEVLAIIAARTAFKVLQLRIREIEPEEPILLQ